MSPNGMRVRFLVNRVSRNILYMEAGKEFVDMLLGFLQLPMATILSVFNNNGEEEEGSFMEVGSISNVYASLRKMSEASLVVVKDKLLNPPCSLKLSRSSPQVLLPAADEVQQPPARPAPTTVYRCRNNNAHLSNVSWASGAICQDCTRDFGGGNRVPFGGGNGDPFRGGIKDPFGGGNGDPFRGGIGGGFGGGNGVPFGGGIGGGFGSRNYTCNSMSSPMHIIDDIPSDKGKANIAKAADSSSEMTAAAPGYVHHYLSFIVTDDLNILPASTVESVVLLSKLNVEKLSDLDSVDVVVLPDEALELLKASFTTRMALNHVFGTKVN